MHNGKLKEVEYKKKGEKTTVKTQLRNSSPPILARKDLKWNSA